MQYNLWMMYLRILKSESQIDVNWKESSLVLIYPKRLFLKVHKKKSTVETTASSHYIVSGTQSFLDLKWL